MKEKKVTFVCSKCGYKETKSYAMEHFWTDVSMGGWPKCRCGNPMTYNSSIKYGIMDTILVIILTFVCLAIIIGALVL